MSSGEFEDNEFDGSDFGDTYTAPPVEKKRRESYPPPFSLIGIDTSRPPGFVGEVTDWIDAQCRYPRRKLAVASALVAMGNITGMRHQDTKDGVTANMIAFCVAASATGKEAVQQAASEIMHTAGLARCVVGLPKSEQEVMRNLIENQAVFYVIDEIGIFLQKVKNAQERGGASYLESIFGTFMNIYSKANSRALMNGDTKRELRDRYGKQLSRAQDDGDTKAAAQAERMLKMVDDGLERPFLSIIGYTTPSTFDGIMTGATATQGFLGRAILVSEHDINPEERPDFKATPIPDHMSARLSMLFTGGDYDMMGARRIEHVGERERIDSTPEAIAMLKMISQWLHSYADLMGEHTGEASVAMVRRSYELVAKVSFVLAIPEGKRTAEHVRWAFAYIKAELDAKIKLVFANDNVKDRPEESIAARVMSYVDPDKGTTLAVLSNRMKMKPEALKPVLDKMQTVGMVREQTGTRKYAGKLVTVWVAVTD